MNARALYQQLDKLIDETYGSACRVEVEIGGRRHALRELVLEGRSSQNPSVVLIAESL